jgi:hypothetical protein
MIMKRKGKKMNKKRITLAFIACMFGLCLSAEAAEPGQQAGVEADRMIEPAGKSCEDDFAQWIEKWGLAQTDGGSRASIWLNFASYKIKVNTMGGGGFEGSFIDEDDCLGGDIRGLFTAPGEFAMVFFNWERYDNRCGFLIKGALDLPPPLPFDGINEIGTTVMSGTLELGSTGLWFHESVNDGLAQDWVAGPGWWVNTVWNPSPTYDMVGTGAEAWSLAYYGKRTYPRPAHTGFHYEACFRKNAGDETYSMALYFNGDGTMDNCVFVPITADGYYSAWEMNGGASSSLLTWRESSHLFMDDTGLTGENVFNMVKVSVLNDGSFDIYINEQYVASAQANYHFSGYVGLAVYDTVLTDIVSCDNMTLAPIH